jgi:predicted short-subunit dehydrogenase-like oxidoreductase (DUF2520 family)
MANLMDTAQPVAKTYGVVAASKDASDTFAVTAESDNRAINCARDWAIVAGLATVCVREGERVIYHGPALRF